jgi:RNA polymerase sigma-70 factor, ECF subfamily
MSSSARRIVAPSEEAQWLTEALGGDAQAFTNLVEAYERPVYNLCYRMLGNSQDAEDAAQESFLRAFQSLRSFDSKRAFSTWLLSIAAHYCIDQIRRRRIQVVSVEELPVPDIKDPAPGMETSISRNEERKKIQHILACLDPLDRAAVVMYYWYDFSYEEICQVLSLSMSALKSRLHRARHALAEEWLKLQHTASTHETIQTSCSGNLKTERMVP